jgi:hypothetical protein
VAKYGALYEGGDTLQVTLDVWISEMRGGVRATRLGQIAEGLSPYVHRPCRFDQ